MTLRGLRKKKKTIVKPKKLKAIVCKSRVMSQVFDVKSHTNPTQKPYRVLYSKKSDRWEWSCNCPAFIFKKIDVSDCKHIREVERKVCRWKSTTSDRRQKVDGICPVCNGPTEFEVEAEMILNDYVCVECGLGFEAFSVDGGEINCTCGGVAEKQLGGRPLKSPGRSEQREKQRARIQAMPMEEIRSKYDFGETKVIDELCMGDDHNGDHLHFQLKETELKPKAPKAKA